MKIYIDCEFNAFGGELISMALVAEDGKEFYESLGCMNPHPWVSENVMPHLVNKPSITLTSFHEQLQIYLNLFESLHLIADWPDDISYFCKSLITSDMGTRIDTPPLTMEVLRVDATSEVPHHALCDARGLKEHLSKNY